MGDPRFPKELADCTVSELLDALQRRGMLIQNVDIGMSAMSPTMAVFRLSGTIMGPACPDFMDYLKRISKKADDTSRSDLRQRT